MGFVPGRTSLGAALEVISAMTADNREGRVARALIGLLALGGAMAGFFLLFYIEIPPRNENALLLALGVVLGWAGAVVGSEYGATTTGRKVAESAIRKIERADIAADSPTGTTDDPIHTEVVNTPNDPLSVAGAASGQPPVETKDAKGA